MLLKADALRLRFHPPILVRVDEPRRGVVVTYQRCPGGKERRGLASPSQPHAASLIRMCSGTGATTPDRRLVLGQWHDDLARMKL